jgi:hypothetical protein
MKETLFEQFADALYQESPRGWAELESMRYGLMARIGLDEPEALELAVKIISYTKRESVSHVPMTPAVSKPKSNCRLQGSIS